MAKIRDPEISAYALQRLLSVLGAADRGDFFVWGKTYANLLRAQGCEEDIHRAIGALRGAKRHRNDANIDAALKILGDQVASPAP